MMVFGDGLDNSLRYRRARLPEESKTSYGPPNSGFSLLKSYESRPIHHTLHTPTFQPHLSPFRNQRTD